MRKMLFLISILAMFLLQSCSGCETQWKHTKSNWFGLERVVVLYDANGKEIKRWKGDLQVENHGGSVSFVLDGKTIIVSGTFTIEEQ